MYFTVPLSWLISNKKRGCVKLIDIPIEHQEKDREPYKIGYRGIALCLTFMFNWVRICMCRVKMTGAIDR